MIDLLRERETSELTHHIPGRSLAGQKSVAENGKNASKVEKKFDFKTGVSCLWKTDLQGIPTTGFLRFYYPLLGRWISRDPIEENDGLNLYAYIKNRSYCKIDVLGLAEYKWETQASNNLIIDDSHLYAGGFGLGHTEKNLDVKTVCKKCEDERWKFDHFQITFTVKIYGPTLKHWKATGGITNAYKHALQNIEIAEKQHQTDLLNWVPKGKAIVEKFIVPPVPLSSASWSTELICMQGTPDGFKWDLSKSAEDAYDNSTRKWDDTGKHSIDRKGDLP